ncbi:glycosyltransferase [Alicyclobacillus shizuokensis]|uniref:glycosyltransferase n=1 Tax=Alicyclobacillus shizuokensis TaxID=392014 RepID=UPI0008323E1E|nr:glycosyltransferase [Alicyclobacillus shizuokensis]MCL6626459.1 glycosyltransferase [Alicyclobacillus shizuokensis]
MKILIATYSAYPRVGGRSTYIKGLKEELEHQGHQVDLVAHAPGLCEIYHSSGHRVNKQAMREQVKPIVNSYFDEYFPHATNWVRWREIERYSVELALRQFQLGDYDLIHAQDILSARCLYRVKPSDIPLVVTYHNVKSHEWYVNQPSKHPLEMEYVIHEEAESAKAADAIIFPCTWLRNTFDGLHVPINNAHVIPYGTRLTFDQTSKTFDDDDIPLIVCPARLVPIKGHATLFDALYRLKLQGYRFRCWIVGDGVLRSSLESLCRVKGLEQFVYFLGNRNDVPNLLVQSDVVVLPTLHDTLPFAVMEAQLAGKPIVASRVGGIPEMIESEKTGWLVEPGNSMELADVLAHLLNLPSQRSKIGLSARRWAIKHWSVTRMVSETLKVYRQALRHDRNTSKDHSIPDAEFLEPLISKWKGVKILCDSNGTIVGRVTTSEGEQITRGTAHLMDISWVTLQIVSVDEHGEFRFTELPTGKYGLMITSPGYPAKSLYVEVTGNKEERIDIQI